MLPALLHRTIIDPGLQATILTIIGHASAIGHAIELPILVRSLADSLMFADIDDLPLQVHDSLLATLDTGIDHDSPGALVTEYLCDWWNGDSAPGPGNVLCPNNLHDAIHRHETQRPYTAVPPVRTAPAPIPLAPGTADCPQCPLYRTLAADILAELHGNLAFAEANETSAMNRWKTDMRRAQGLHILHEAVQLKEMRTVDAGTSRLGTTAASGSGSAPTVFPAIPGNRRSRRVFNTAVAELARLQELPAASHKWTWGPELSAIEVRELVPLPARRRRLHSGYNTSLPDGGYHGQSATQTLPGSPNSAQYSDVSDHVRNYPTFLQAYPSVDKISYVDYTAPTRRQIDPDVPSHADTDCSPNPDLSVPGPHPPSIMSEADPTGIDEAAEVWGNDADDSTLDGDAHNPVPDAHDAIVDAVDPDADEVNPDADKVDPDAECLRADADPHGRAAQRWVVEDEVQDVDSGDADGKGVDAAAEAWGDDDDADVDNVDLDDPDAAELAAETKAADKAAQVWGDDAIDSSLHDADAVDQAAQMWGDDEDEDDVAHADHADAMANSHQVNQLRSPSVPAQPQIFTVNDAIAAWGDDDTATGANTCISDLTDARLVISRSPPLPPQHAMHPVDIAASAWSDCDEESPMDVDADIHVLHVDPDPDADADADADPDLADHDIAAIAWGDDSDAHLSPDDSDTNTGPHDAESLPTAHDAENAWDSNDDSSGTGGSATNASSSSPPADIHHRSDIPLVVTPSRITLPDVYSADFTPARVNFPYVYSASDFDFVDDTWLPEGLGRVEEEDSNEDNDDFST